MLTQRPQLGVRRLNYALIEKLISGIDTPGHQKQNKMHQLEPEQIYIEMWN